MFEKIDHIAIAVDDLAAAIDMYESIFGLKVCHREYVEDYHVEIATIHTGSCAIELIEGQGDDSPIRRFVQTRGPGIHHIAFVVDDIRESLEKLRQQGIRLIDATPRRGKNNSLVAFIHPKAAQRVLYELVELGGSTKQQP
ncbi:MAG: methylmalonyl-CoA epimerase [Candidatus Krumholzibacteria bacterium]|nr:methylmalonyl-CoA epimerase [Candidatus Krumholzibacteria bacterium]